MGRKNRDDCIYTPDVLVFREDNYECTNLDEKEWFHVDVITCAAPDQRYDPGPGAFQPTREELLEVFENVLKNYLYYFHTVEFAVYSLNEKDVNFKAFSELNGIKVLQTDKSNAPEVWQIPEAFKRINYQLIQKTIDTILKESAIYLEDCVDGAKWISDDYLRPELAKRAGAFQGGLRGLVSYKRYKYAQKYVQSETKGIRYRYVAAAIIMIGNAFGALSDSSAEVHDIRKVYQQYLSIHLSQTIPSGNDCFLDNDIKWEQVIKLLQESFQSTGSPEARTMLRVLKALE